MKTRKMWVKQKVFEGGGTMLCFEHDLTPLERGIYEPRTPVLVTDASDMPDFEPGDRVRGNETGRIGLVLAVGMMDHGWGVFWRPDRHALTWEHPHNLTKLPREKTVTLRVTFAGHPDPDGFVSNLSTCEGVRVERVEDDR